MDNSPLITLGFHTFREGDCLKFAQLSGDNNPVHIDRNVAANTPFGVPIVYGVLTLLTALDFASRAGISFSGFVARFIRPLKVGATVEFIFEETTHRVVVRTGLRTMMAEIKLVAGPGVARRELIHDSLDAVDGNILTASSDSPRNLSFDELRVGMSIVCESVPPNPSAVELFPSLVDRFGTDRVSELAYLSKVVGMEVPGFNSILNEIECHLLDDRVAKSVAIVTELDDRFSRVRLGYYGNSLIGSITASFRNFAKDISCSEIIAGKYNDINLSGLRLLVIGGSRGIGATLCKLAAMCGAELVFTYHSQADRAKIIAEEIMQHSDRPVRTIKFDVENIEQTLDMTNFDAFFYFPTPKIFGNYDYDSRRALFEKYESIYCENFLRLGIQFQRSGGKIIYYPSSQAIGSRFASLRQYSSAKILGEIACDTLQEGWGGVIIKDRLGITKTWQTAGHVDKDASEPIEAAKAILRKVFLCRWIFEECQFK